MLEADASELQITMLANSFPLNTTMELQRKWLPDLLAEVESMCAGNELPTSQDIAPVDPALQIQEEQRESEMLASGWYLHGSSLSLRYRANGHADPLLKTLLDASGRDSCLTCHNYHVR